MKVIGVLPAAGLAKRMNGIPKFMLPIGRGCASILDYHASFMASLALNLHCFTRPSWEELVSAHLAEFDNVSLRSLETATMSETIRVGLESEKWDWAVLGMPDTVFSLGENPYAALVAAVRDLQAVPHAIDSPQLIVSAFPTSSEQVGSVGSISYGSDLIVSAHADKDPSRNFGQHWGAMAFNRPAFEMLDPSTPHVGYLISALLTAGFQVRVVEHEFGYIDCGVLSEYIRALGES